MHKAILIVQINFAIHFSNNFDRMWFRQDGASN